MALYVGQAISVVAQATDPNHKTAITDATAEVDFFAPGKNPAKVPEDRVVDKGPFAMAYDATVANQDGSKGAFVAYVDTANWVAGKWAFRVTLSGSYDSWEFSTVKLDA